MRSPISRPGWLYLIGCGLNGKLFRVALMNEGHGSRPCKSVSCRNHRSGENSGPNKGPGAEAPEAKQATENSGPGRKDVPQGPKPGSLLSFYGPTKVVP